MSAFRLGSSSVRPGGFEGPTRIDPAGPDDLAGLAIGMRQYARTEAHDWSAPITDDGLRRLIQFAYNASLHPHEGRFLDFAVYCAPPSDLRDLASFAAPYPIDDPRDLVRLAPICTADGVELRVTEAGGRLSVVGVGHTAEIGVWAGLGRPTIGEGVAGRVLTLRSRGPGRLHLHECWDLALNRSIACVESDFERVAGVRRATAHAAQLVHDRISERHGAEVARRFGGRHGVDGLIARSLSAVVADMLRLGHGGMLVLLPDEIGGGGESQSWFRDGRRLTPGTGLGSAVEAYWSASLLVDVQSPPGELDRQLERQSLARRRLEQAIRTVAGLSLPDGANVLDARLQVISFGTQIRSVDAHIEASALEWRDLQDGYLLPAAEAVDGLRGGTRHKTGLRTCFASPQTTVVVVSQDHAVTCFWSDRAHVTGQHDISVRPMPRL